MGKVDRSEMFFCVPTAERTCTYIREDMGIVEEVEWVGINKKRYL